MALGLITPTEGAVELFGRDPMRDGRAGAGGRGRLRRGAALLPLPERAQEPRTARGARRRRRAPAASGRCWRRSSWPRAQATASAATRTACASASGIAAALLRRPRLLILDEPATGLDPAGMRDMRTLIRRLADDGITVLLSSHQLPEVQELCDRVAIVRSRPGRLRGGARGPAPPGRYAGYACAPPTTRARSRCCAPSRASATLAKAAHGLEFEAEERDVGERLARARALRHRRSSP